MFDYIHALLGDVTRVGVHAKENKRRTYTKGFERSAQDLRKAG